MIRSKYDCIVSTSNSINKDNSLLNCRIDGLNNYKPDLIIIDRKLKLKKKLKLYNFTNKRRTYIFTTSNDNKKLSFFKKKIKVIKIDKLENNNDFKNLFKQIFKIGKGRVLVEAGLVFLKELFKFKIINDLYLFKSNIILRNKGLNNTSINFLRKIKLIKNINVNLVDEKLYKIRIK